MLMSPNKILVGIALLGMAGLKLNGMRSSTADIFVFPEVRDFILRQYACLEYYMGGKIQPALKICIFLQAPGSR